MLVLQKLFCLLVLLVLSFFVFICYNYQYLAVVDLAVTDLVDLSDRLVKNDLPVRLVKKEIETQQKTNNTNKPKIILYWNKIHGVVSQLEKLFSNSSKSRSNCKYLNCMVTSDRDLLPIAHAVIFQSYHGHQHTLPKRKYPQQIWILLLLEPPTNIVTELYNNVINWTVSYKPESDIRVRMLRFCLKEKPVKIDFQQIVKKKSKMVAWFVSHCSTSSHRENYVRELMKYIKVDVYGVCSEQYNQTTPSIFKQKQVAAAYIMLNNDYKFYLSFESCFHDGYVTEYIIYKNVVPIVRGAGNYSQLAIPNSYINANDYKSPKELAAYLHELDKNDEKYVEYFKYKEKYNRWCNLEVSGLCLLCKMLNENKPFENHYKNITKWNGHCQAPKDL